MREDKKENKREDFLLEEKPVIELPGLLWVVIISAAFCLGLSTLFLPKLIIIALALGVTFSIVVFLKPIAGLFSLLTGMYLQPFEFIPVLQSFHITRTLAFITLFSWVLKMIITREIRIVKTPQNWLTIGFCCVVLATTFMDFDWSFPQFIAFSRMIILYFLVVNLITNKKQLTQVIWCFIILGTILAVLGIYEHFSGVPILQYAVEREARRVHQAEIYRTSGVFGEHGDYAMYLIVIIPFIFGIIFSKRNIFVKNLLFISLALIIIAIIFSYSRAGMIAMLAVLFFFVLKLKKKGVIAIASFFLISLMLLPLIPSRYWEHAKTVFDTNNETIRVRINLTKTAWQMILKHPLTGIGFRNFQPEFYYYAPPEAVYTVNVEPVNLFVQVMAENGILALLLLIGLIVNSIIYLDKAVSVFKSKKEEELAAISSAIKISFLGFLVGYQFLAPGAYTYNFWILIGLAVAIRHISIQMDKIKDNTN